MLSWGKDRAFAFMQDLLRQKYRFAEVMCFGRSSFAPVSSRSHSS